LRGNIWPCRESFECELCTQKMMENERDVHNTRILLGEIWEQIPENERQSIYVRFLKWGRCR
jgi:hypothetical protein